MDFKLDLRIQKTYLALSNTLIQMLSEMSFDDIKVKDLCERAMVRKSTFYKHFADKQELLTYIVKDILANLNSRLPEESLRINKVDYYVQLTSMILDLFYENQNLVMTIVKSNSFPMIQSVFSEQILLAIKERLKVEESNGETLPATPEILAAFFTAGLLGVLKTWMLKERPANADELKEQLDSILRTFYKGACPN